MKERTKTKKRKSKERTIRKTEKKGMKNEERMKIN